MTEGKHLLVNLSEAFFMDSLYHFFFFDEGPCKENGEIDDGLEDNWKTG